ncbi:MAG: SurA N-terminal domain-containing protein, partial [Kiritimatiellae bacterium]|nr:SurA N-terminal domain-containing protein [Kiritimatiellia bacterium]
MKSVLAAFGPAVASLFVVPAALAAAAPPLASFPVDAQVATVNGESIAISDVMRELPATLRSPAFANAGAMPEEALFRAAFREALDTLVDRALVLQRYWAGDQRLPAHAIDKTVAEIIEDRYGGNLQNLLEDLAAERMTYAEWRDRMQERLIVASMRHGFADGLAYVSPSEISEEYERRKPEFARTGWVMVLGAAFSGAGAATDAAVTA